MALTTVKNAGLAGSIDLTAKVTGTLPVANGGTALSSGFVNGGVLLTGSKTGNGGTGNGSGVDMLTSDSIDLSSYQNKHLIVYGQTAISENANTGNTSVLRIELSNGSTVVTLSASRQGMGVYGTGDYNNLAHLSAFAVYQIASAYATTCTIRLNGGIDSGNFTYGDQNDYSHFDGEGAGIGMRYYVI